MGDNFTERVRNAIELMDDNPDEAMGLFEGIISDLNDYSPEEIRKNGLTWEVVNAYNAKGAILNGEGKIDEAEECFDRVIDYYGENNPCALLNKGLISRKRKNYDKALEYYDEALKEDSNLKDFVFAVKREVFEMMSKDDDVDLSDSVMELIGRGNDFAENQNYFAAIDCFRKAAEEDSSCENIVWGLIEETKYKFEMMFQWEALDFNADEISNQKGAVIHYLFSKNPSYAFAINEGILHNFDENDRFALNSKGLIQFYLGDYDGAVESFDECLTVDENYMWAYINKGIVLKFMGREKEARESYRQIMTMPRRFDKPSEDLISLYHRALLFDGVFNIWLL